MRPIDIPFKLKYYIHISPSSRQWSFPKTEELKEFVKIFNKSIYGE